MSTADELRSETGRLSRMLVFTADQTKSHFARSIVPLGISVPAARALLSITSATPMRELAKNLAWDPSYLTGLADELEASGLVVRTTGSDRRVKVLELTAEGRAMRARIGEAVAAGEPLSTRIDDTDRATLARILTQLLADD